MCMQRVIFTLHKADRQGQRALQKELKPATAKGKAKAKAGPKAAVKAKAAPKAAASGSPAPPDGAADVDVDSWTFSVRKHKRKTPHGELRIFAIHCIDTGKQMAQLSESVCQDAESVVGNLVSQLNDKSLSLADALARLAEIKVS